LPASPALLLRDEIASTPSTTVPDWMIKGRADFVVIVQQDISGGLHSYRPRAGELRCSEFVSAASAPGLRNHEFLVGGQQMFPHRPGYWAGIEIDIHPQTCLGKKCGTGKQNAQNAQEPTPHRTPFYCALDSQRDIISAISLLFFS